MITRNEARIILNELTKSQSLLRHMRTVELVMEFEDEFETSIPDEEAEKIQTVGQAIDYIKQAVGS